MSNNKPLVLPHILESAFLEIKNGTEEIIPEESLQRKLLKSYETGIPLIIKAGFDPTAPDLHLGHTVLLQKLKVFQELGHTVHFLIGDYTAMIGDPTGKSETRPPLTSEDVNRNAQTYKEQVFKILDANKTVVTYNSAWLSKMDLKDIIQLCGKYTIARILERDDFSKRYQGGKPISMVEFLYPLLQGYDSVAMKADVELGGTDQKFNLLVGRDLQISYSQSPQIVITLPLLVGLDGTKKMSKSLGNYIGIKEPAIEIYGKIMSISDTLMWDYYNLISGYTIDEISNLKQKVEDSLLHPKKVKEELAIHITSRFYNSEIANTSRDEWLQIHNPNDRGLPNDIPLWQANSSNLVENQIKLLDALRLSGSVTSNSEARRLITSGGVYQINSDSESTVLDLNQCLSRGEYLFRIGKRKFIKIKI